ncbi:hypothetical protein [Stenotrophomonas sp. RG-453]|uniref:hypothetical protein n=1 Tax=Stenotrophomonas sp. RG-453 TaxID=2957502 RepID=UPI0029CA9F03|nr:hypothetical protein [Stenotrophomonas sp. RG-453]MDX5515086.1 hypothetical protein [Stenotrophomonas sp. RG-453]
MTPATILRSIGVLLLIAALGAGAYAVHTYRSAMERVSKLEETAEQFDELKQSVATLNREAIRRATLDQAIRDARNRVDRSVETARNEEPAVRAYLDERIPDGLRDAHLGARKP